MTSTLMAKIMAKIILSIGSLFVIVNSIIGLLISNYLPFNWLTVNVILVINTAILFNLITDNISDGCKITLFFTYLILCIISIVLMLLSPKTFIDNYYLIGFLFVIVVEVLLYLIAKGSNSSILK